MGKSTISLYLKGAYLGAIFMLSYCVNAKSNHEFEASYTADYFKVMEGGVTEDSAYLDNLNLILGGEVGSFSSVGQFTYNLHFLYNNATTLNDLVGDAQVASNIDNDEVYRLYEAWVEKEFTGQSIKFGLYDLNSEFDTIEPASLFLNSSHGIGPDFAQSGENGPSIFPTTSLAFRYFRSFKDNLHFRIAILDGVPGDPDDSEANTIDLSSEDGILLASELEFQHKSAVYKFGYWRYSEKTETLDGSEEESNHGLYASYANEMALENEKSSKFSYWLRLGLANSNINQFDQYLGFGVVLSGVFSAEETDSIGLAVARVSNSSEYSQLDPTAEDNEMNFELTYSYQVNQHVRIQPDIQYIQQPGASELLDDALVVGVRLELTN